MAIFTASITHVSAVFRSPCPHGAGFASLFLVRLQGRVMMLMKEPPRIKDKAAHSSDFPYNFRRAEAGCVWKAMAH